MVTFNDQLEAESIHLSPWTPGVSLSVSPSLGQSYSSDSPAPCPDGVCSHPFQSSACFPEPSAVFDAVASCACSLISAPLTQNLAHAP